MSNIGIIVKELFKENIVRGRGVLCRSVMQAQAFSQTFTHVYAALVAVINTKFPQIGELLLKRLIIQLRRGIKRNDKALCLSSCKFIAHLVNQQVAHEIVALQVLGLLFEKVQDRMDDSEAAAKSRDNCAELAAAFMAECGSKLEEVSSASMNSIYVLLKDVIHDGQIGERVKFGLENVWKDVQNHYKDKEAVIKELDLVEEDDQITHMLEIDAEVNGEDILNVYRHDPEYEATEEKYKEIKASILNGSSDEESGDSEGGGDASSGSDTSDEGDDKEKEDSENKKMDILDQTEGNMLIFRRTVYLTLKSSLTVDEAAHKLMKGEIKPGWELELCNMILDCCAQERTFIKFFALLAQRFCNINRTYQDCFKEIFTTAYDTCHRLDAEKLRNVARLFAHLFVTDAISWDVFHVVKLDADNTTSSSRVFLKILFQVSNSYYVLAQH